MSKGELAKMPEDAYTVLDLLDEEAISLELAGLEAQELIYSFKIEGREVTGLSWPGAKALARWMAEKGHPLDAVERQIASDDEAWYADVKVVDRATGLGLWGSSMANKMRQVHVLDENGRWAKNPDGSWKMVEKPDRFARTIAFNKAQRNGIRAHVPDKMIALFIKEAVEQGKVRKVSQEEVRRKVESEARVVEPSEAQPPKSYDELHYRLSEHILDIDGTLSIVEHDQCFTVEKERYLDDEVWAMINDIIVSMGGEWISKGKHSHWRIPKQ